jgi:Dullard-like phosphatase family protein
LGEKNYRKTYATIHITGAGDIIMLRSRFSVKASKSISISLLSTSIESGNQWRQSRFYAATAIAARWVPPEQRVARGKLPDIRARRPLVNGKAVAFHVSELATLPSATPYCNNGIQVDTRRLSPSSKQYVSDMIVVLDMDECLIHSKFMTSPQDAQLYAHQLLQQNQVDMKCNGLAVDSFQVTLFDGSFVHVHVRPGLYEFLQRVCSRYETHIFTAAMDVYANPVLDHIETKLNENNCSSGPETKFAGRWYRQHCTTHSSCHAKVKNLTNLWPQIQYQQNRPTDDISGLCRAVLVDNNPMSFLSNPENGILVPSFYTDSQDAALLEVWEILQQLEQEDDVRPTLTQKFALREYLDS